MADARAGSPHPSPLPEGEGSYHAALMLRWMTAAAGLPEDLRRRHGAWLAAAQREDGGFAGRRGSSDVYYTGFALRGLAMLGQLTSAAARRAGDFLAARSRARRSACRGRLRVAAGRGDPGGSGRRRRCLRPRRPRSPADGAGHFRAAPPRRTAATPRPPAAQGSLYQTFLAVPARKWSASARARRGDRRLVRSRRRDDGGFAELGRHRNRAARAPRPPRWACCRCSARWTNRCGKGAPDFWRPCRRPRAGCGPMPGCRWPTC